MLVADAEAAFTTASGYGAGGLSNYLAKYSARFGGRGIESLLP